MARVKAALGNFFSAVMTLVRLSLTVALALIPRYFELGGFFTEGIPSESGLPKEIHIGKNLMRFSTQM
jgi:hypothetical protein